MPMQPPPDAPIEDWIEFFWADGKGISECRYRVKEKTGIVVDRNEIHQAYIRLANRC